MPFVNGPQLPGLPADGELFGGEPVEQRRIGRGRPKGAQNLHSAKVRAWILGRFDNPLEGLAALALPADMLQVVDKARALAPALRCSAKEAVEIMIKCSEAANRYLNAPPPVQVDVNDRRVVLAFGLGSAPEPGEATQDGLAALRQALLERAATTSAADRKADGEVIDAIAEIVDETRG
jgi:hypothetical protein